VLIDCRHRLLNSIVRELVRAMWTFPLACTCSEFEFISVDANEALHPQKLRTSLHQTGRLPSETLSPTDYIGCRPCTGRQEAQLSSRDRAMRRVSWNLANCHATVQKLLVRLVLNTSKLWSWRDTVGQCAPAPSRPLIMDNIFFKTESAHGTYYIYRDT